MTVAERIIKKCGGVEQTAKHAGCSANWVYRWRLPRGRGGTGGNVPQQAQRNLLIAAASGLVEIHPADFFDFDPHGNAASPRQGGAS